MARPRGCASYSLLGQRLGGAQAPYQLERPSSGRSPSPPASRRDHHPSQRCRNLDLLSIAYASRPRLRPDSPAADQPGSGNLGFPAVGVLAPRIVTHPDIRTRLRSAAAHAATSRPRRRSPTTGPCGPILRFGASFSPGTLSARGPSTSELLRTLSRMAASKPTSWLSGRPYLLAH